MVIIRKTVLSIQLVVEEMGMAILVLVDILAVLPLVVLHIRLVQPAADQEFVLAVMAEKVLGKIQGTIQVATPNHGSTAARVMVLANAVFAMVEENFDTLRLLPKYSFIATAHSLLWSEQFFYHTQRMQQPQR